MDVRIAAFPKTRVASITHFGPPEREHVTVQKLIAWKIHNQFLDRERHRHYGLHHITPGEHRVDFCMSIDEEVGANSIGISEMVIPEWLCAVATDVGSRSNNQAVQYLLGTWLPASAYERADFPVIFHYVNVGPNIAAEDEITDVYVPLTPLNPHRKSS